MATATVIGWVVLVATLQLNWIAGASDQRQHQHQQQQQMKKQLKQPELGSG
jgi:hypothetical protein